MTLDDLEKIYDQAPADERNSGKRAGIAAVVRALRDEMCVFYEDENVIRDTWEIYTEFNEILGDAGAAAGGSAERADEQRATAPAADLSVGQRLIKAAKEAASMAKADAVCVWTHGQKGGVRPSCSERYEYAPYHAKLSACPECKKPIQFKEPSHD